MSVRDKKRAGMKWGRSEEEEGGEMGEYAQVNTRHVCHQLEVVMCAVR